MRREQHAVYAIGMIDGTVWKIGVAQSPLARVKEMQTGNHAPLSIGHAAYFGSRIIAEQVEYAAHRLLREKNIRGEWFSVSLPEAVEIIEQAAKWVINRRGNLGCYGDAREPRNLGVPA